MVVDTSTIISFGVLATVLVVMKVMPRLMAGVPFVGCSDLRAKIDQGEPLLVIDVRSEGEFTGPSGHIAGALNLPLGEIKERLGAAASGLEPYKHTPVYVMCHAANRSPYGARALKKAGFTNVNVVKGGMSGWLRLGFPATRR
ncbi:MAG: rhodanese-like domain-containing protein [Alphaproteobacteria bacterium]|nr:rhodanese-like domain-containing protein [Alphaproteobacteria bacterium]